MHVLFLNIVLYYRDTEIKEGVNTYMFIGARGWKCSHWVLREGEAGGLLEDCYWCVDREQMEEHHP